VRARTRTRRGVATAAGHRPAVERARRGECAPPSRRVVPCCVTCKVMPRHHEVATREW
jgi:hypothetical protein